MPQKLPKLWEIMIGYLKDTVDSNTFGELTGTKYSSINNVFIYYMIQNLLIIRWVANEVVFRSPGQWFVCYAIQTNFGAHPDTFSVGFGNKVVGL